MVDPGETVSLTVRREFMEEALDSTSVTSIEERAEMEKMVNAFFDRNQTLVSHYRTFQFIDSETCHEF